MELGEVFADPGGVDAWRLGEAELVAVTRAVGARARIVQLEALRVRLVAEVESRGTAKALGVGSTAWLSGVSRMSPGTATRIVNLGRALAGCRRRRRPSRVGPSVPPTRG